MYEAAEVSTRLPLTVRVPIELPGASAPPTVRLPRVPLPPRVPPAFTVTPAAVPLTTNMPPLFTVVSLTMEAPSAIVSVPPFTVVAPV